MNSKQVSKLRVEPGDLLLVRGKMPIEEIQQLRAHFSDRVTVVQIPHRNFIQKIPYPILERIVDGNRKSFLAQQFEELGECVRITFPMDEAKLLGSLLAAHGDKAWDRELAVSAANRLRDAIFPAEALEAKNHDAKPRS